MPAMVGVTTWKLLTRNARLAAIRSFFRYAALRHPEADALVAAPDRDTWTGRRDHALTHGNSRCIRPAVPGAPLGTHGSLRFGRTHPQGVS